MAKKQKFVVTLSFNVGYTDTVEAESEDEAIKMVQEAAEATLLDADDCVDYADCDDSCTQVGHA